MLLFDVVFALVIALALAVTFAIVMNRPGPWASFLSFFAVMFLAVWAAGLWLTPTGPEAYGVSWLSMLTVGLIVGLLLAASGPAAEGSVRLISRSDLARRSRLDLFFVFLVVALVLAVAAGYLLGRPTMTLLLSHALMG